MIDLTKRTEAKTSLCLCSLNYI